MDEEKKTPTLRETNPPLLKFFSHAHLKEGKLRDMSAAFTEFAGALAEAMPANAEATMALRKLLEAKDCAVRSLLP